MNSRESNSWISRFCRQRENELFCEVKKDYIKFSRNLIGLNQTVPYYRETLNLILDGPSDPLYVNPRKRLLVQRAAKRLYGLIHARYILTEEGMAKMIRKYQKGDFGKCLRFYCDSQKMLPMGLTDVPGEIMVRLYCPKCRHVYFPQSVAHMYVDGAYFGTRFLPKLLSLYPEYLPEGFVPVNVRLYIPGRYYPPQ